MQYSSILILASSIVIFALGSAHLVLTYLGPKLTPRDPSLTDKLKSAALSISSQTTVWKAWVGFNASHSLGAMFFGLIYGYLALFQSTLLFESVFLGLLGGLVLCGYAVLARLYWFSTPFRGIVLALILYLAGFSVERVV
jgi:hypothetical protein